MFTLTEGEEQNVSAAEGVREWAGTARSRRERKPNITPARAQRFAAEAEHMRETQDWDDATPGHLVALYAWCHAKVYGVEAAELHSGATYAQAVAAAKRLVDVEFSGDVTAAVGFVRWTWGREASRERWRRENGRDGGRIGWRLQFGPAMMTDYRIAMARARQVGST